MISSFVQTRLNEVNKDKFEESEKEFVLTETKDDGRAEYRLSLSRPSLLFKKLDEWKFDWLKQGKCADYVVLEPTDDGVCDLHIIVLDCFDGVTCVNKKIRVPARVVCPQWAQKKLTG